MLHQRISMKMNDNTLSTRLYTSIHTEFMSFSTRIFSINIYVCVSYTFNYLRYSILNEIFDDWSDVIYHLIMIFFKKCVRRFAYLFSVYIDYINPLSHICLIVYLDEIFFVRWFGEYLLIIFRYIIECELSEMNFIWTVICDIVTMSQTKKENFFCLLWLSCSLY